jgi:uncharacterized peroxidase-related enzyme
MNYWFINCFELFGSSQSKEIMAKIAPLSPEDAAGKVRELLETAQERWGMVPNVLKTLANSEAALEAWVHFTIAMEGAALSAELREKVSLAVSEANGSDYCLRLHAALGRAAGLTNEEIRDSRLGKSTSSRTEAALDFARALLRTKGHVGEEGLARLRKAGFRNSEIVELTVLVAMNVFSNYLTLTAGTAPDFPPVAELPDAAPRF